MLLVWVRIVCVIGRPRRHGGTHEEAPLRKSERGWSWSQALGVVGGRVNFLQGVCGSAIQLSDRRDRWCVLVLSFVDQEFRTQVASLPV